MEILIQVLDDLDDLWQRLPALLHSSHARSTLSVGLVTICTCLGAIGLIAQ